MEAGIQPVSFVCIVTGGEQKRMSEIWYPTEAELRRRVGDRPLEAGDVLERRGAVLHPVVTRMEDRISVEAGVLDGEIHKTRVLFRDAQKLIYYCTCRNFRRVPLCPHGACLLLYAVRHRKLVLGEPEVQTSPDTRAVLDLYLKKAEDISDYLRTDEEHPVTEEDELSLQPEFTEPYTAFSTMYRRGDAKTRDTWYPGISFSIRSGRGRYYMVRDIPSLVEMFRTGGRMEYGKSTTIRHERELLDPESRKVLELLEEQFRLDQEAFDHYTNYFSISTLLRDSICLRGDRFDALVDLYLEKGILGVRSQKQVFLSTQNLPVEISLKKAENAVSLDVHGLESGMPFRTSRYCYVLDNSGRTQPVLHRVDPAFYEAVYSLICRNLKDQTLNEKDLALFGRAVIEPLKEFAKVRDEDGLLEKEIPEKCIPCFYLDQGEKGQLTCFFEFRYPEKTLAWNHKANEGVRCDEIMERKAVALVKHFFNLDSSGRAFVISDPDQAAAFFMEEIETFRRVGEVYVSDRLKRREFDQNTVSLGLSISGDSMLLDFDTGQFPVEELESLYQSLLLKKKYHRLANGMIVRLNGGGLEALAEAAHMAQMKTEDLKSGHVSMPVYRALYLDLLFRKQEGMRQIRDDQFREMIQRFSDVRNTGFQIPEMFRDTVRGYQETGFQWLKTLEHSHFGGILADEMGLGKTLQMITFFSTASRAEKGKGSLVVCPASLILNWGDELQKYAPQIRFTLIMGNLATRRQLIHEHGDDDLWVTSYDLLKRDIDEYREIPFYACVLDEAQYVKNQTTQASKAVKLIQAEQRFVMTGTPIENRISELWNLFDFLMPGYLFSHSRFVEKLENPIIRSDSPGAREQLKRMVQPFVLRRLKKDVLSELPPKMEFIRRIELSTEEQKIYAASVAAARSELNGKVEKLAILAALTRLRQICCDPRLCYENYHGGTSKLDACVELVQSMTENGHQILLFSQFTSMLTTIEERLRHEGISCEVFRGSTTKEKRAELVRSFNEGGFQVFLISLKAGGTGLNLTAADIVIHYDPWWNMAAQNQATDRAHRIGQQEKVQVYKLIASRTIEEKILQLQEKKSMLLDSITEDSDEGILKMSAEDLLALLES